MKPICFYLKIYYSKNRINIFQETFHRQKTDAAWSKLQKHNSFVVLRMD